MSQSEEICWYHPKISREVGEKLLQENPRKVNGLFIVRDSISSPSDYVLSVLCETEVNNYQIRRHQEDAIFSINESVKFHGLENLIDFYKKTPLAGNGLVLTEFVKGHQPPHQTMRSGSSNLLHRATNVGNYEIVTRLLQSGYMGCDAKNQDGKTAAHLAASNGQNDILRKLIDHQVNVNLRDAMGVTPLHYACKYNRPLTVKLLITSGKANIQARNTENGEVPLHVAASEGHLEVVKMLLAFHAPIKPRTKKNLVPAQLARKKGHNNCASFLDNYECPSPTISRNDFYHGTLDRNEAEEKIMAFNAQSGVYLVRYSERFEAYILSLFHEKVRNYVIKKEDGYFLIDDGPLLNSLEHLVEHYSIMSDGLPTNLITPVPPPPKPNAPPISTLKKNNLKTVRPKLQIPQGTDNSNEISTPLMFKNISFVSDLNLVDSTNDIINNNRDPLDKVDRFIDPANLTCKGLIGEGEFASVYEGLLLKDRTEIKVAIKTLRNEHAESNKVNFDREAQVMLGLNHHCIVKLLGICLGPPLQMIQELVPLGAILQYIDKHQHEINPKFEFTIWAAQIACGMHYLEENRFVHRDLAARNILLSSKYQAKISDFGLSRALESNHEYYRALKGGRWPLKWYAPESYNYGQFDHKSDVWSFGVTIWEIYSYGATPYDDMKGAEAIILIDNGKRLEKPKACPEEVYLKMLECWAQDKDQRPAFKELVEFFQCDYMNIRELIPEANLV
ncbi:tyrosine-protein kinase Shark [Euwallacea similis]|uniref:tyrosine-protein kinase Shark n=1 Tax=Euwallacea similis TaxID=1736056 RepID=UPI00344DFF66